MDFLLWCFTCINEKIFALPALLLFVGTALVLTLHTRFLQIRGLPRFFTLISNSTHQHSQDTHQYTISPIRALLTAMGTTIGMGNMVGPTIAIITGGPGALFWLLFYILLGSVTKFAEVVFALKTRITTSDGHVVGGPMYYLQSVHPWLAYWYAGVMVFLFAGWSSIQSNTLAAIFMQENVPAWLVGLVLAIIVLLVLQGGAHRVGAVASKLVPLMFVLYISFALFILLKNISAVWQAILLVVHSIFKPSAALGGLSGIGTLQVMRAGIYRGIYITEAGLGSSSIAHAVAETKNPVDQGILALFSAAADSFLCGISGLLVLVTGVWLDGNFRSTLIYEAFKLHAPATGSVILLGTISLFVITTVIGNSFNGVQTFGSLTDYKGVRVYVCITAIVIFLGSLMQARLAWEVMDTLLTLVAIPNLIGILVLTYKNKKSLQY